MVWHGGEPLTLGVKYYRQCLEDLCEISKNRGFDLPTGIQTNAVLIDQDWIDLFKEFNVQVGVSVDGPNWLHDQRRLHRNGKASHLEVERGIELLRKADIQFSVISVLSATSLDYPDEIFDYFRTLPTNKGFAFNIDENDGANTNSSIITVNDSEGMFAKVRQFF
jgi:uncharacterized protein